MQTSSTFLKAANTLVSVVVGIFMCLAGIYAVYALWDNHQIYSAAQNVQEDMLKLKPTAEENGPSFEELMAVNSDVCAWITLDNTGIDYPVLQGENNLSYINTDVYGDFALAGSIFLDSRNSNDFQDAYSLLYGHHMENGEMFGDLDLYKDESFFNENRTGTLILPDRTYSLEIFACLLSPASDDTIFNPQQWQDNIDGLLEHVRSEALHVDEEIISDLEASESPQVLAMSTCSTEYTDARTIILAVMK